MTRRTPEGKFDEDLMQDIRDLFPGCYIFKLDTSQNQGVPDRLVLWGPHWFTLELKASRTAKKQLNQDYHVGVMNNMSFSAFIYPENKEEIIRGLCDAFGVGR